MTGKSTARKKPASRKRAAPSAAELKRQAAREKQRADVAEATANEANERVDRLEGMLEKFAANTSQAIETLTEKVEQATKPKSAAAKALRDDDVKQLAGQILGTSEEDIGLPEKPANILPDHLVEASRKFLAQEEARSRRAVDNPVTRTTGITETEEQPIGQFEERVLNSKGPASEALDPLRMEDEAVILENGKMYSREKMEHEMFMHELVCIRVHEATDENANPIPEVMNGGRTQYFIRGRDQWVKRWALEPLLRAKKTTYKQRKQEDGEGDDQYVNIPRTALRYPFAVIKDTPRGHQWVRNILHEAV